MFFLKAGLCLSITAAAMASTTTFVIGRHGKTPMNALGKISGGQSDPELTEEGLKEAEELGLFLAQYYPDLFDVAYCSTQKRSAVTAEIAFEQFTQKFQIIPMRDFREIDHGESEGIDAKLRAEIWRKYVSESISTFKLEHPNDPIDPFLKWKMTPFQGAETFEALGKRVSEALVAIARQFPDKKVAVIAHNAVMQALIMRSLYAQSKLERGEDGLYPMFFEASLIPNCAIALFECDPDLEENQDRIKFLRTEALPKKPK